MAGQKFKLDVSLNQEEHGGDSVAEEWLQAMQVALYRASHLFEATLTHFGSRIH